MEGGEKSSKGFLELYRMQAAVTPGLSRRFKQLKKWEQSRYNEVYACPCCRGRFRLAKAMDDGNVFEIAKVVDAGEILFWHLGEKILPPF